MKAIRILSFALFTSMLIIAACDKSSNCTPVPYSGTYTVNGYDTASMAPYYNSNTKEANIVNFVFTQSTITYTGFGTCPNETCGLSLVIQNRTGKKLSFSYTIGLSGLNFEDSVVIDSLSSASYSSLSTNCTTVNSPVTTIQLSNIKYDNIVYQ